MGDSVKRQGIDIIAVIMAVLILITSEGPDGWAGFGKRAFSAYNTLRYYQIKSDLDTAMEKAQREQAAREAAERAAAEQAAREAAERAAAEQAAREAAERAAAEQAAREAAERAAAEQAAREAAERAAAEQAAREAAERAAAEQAAREAAEREAAEQASREAAAHEDIQEPEPVIEPELASQPEPEPVQDDTVRLYPGVSENTRYLTAEQIRFYKNYLTGLINEYRAANGLNTLDSDPYLESAATVRALENSVESFTHTRPDGTRGFYVIEALGGVYEETVKAIRDRVYGRSGFAYDAGENLAYTYAVDGEGYCVLPEQFSGTDEELIAIATQTFNNWRNSSTHNANMLHGNYTAIGIGINASVRQDDGTFYILAATLFCKTY